MSEKSVYDLCYDDEVYLNFDCSDCPYLEMCGNPNEKYVPDEYFDDEDYF